MAQIKVCSPGGAPAQRPWLGAKSRIYREASLQASWHQLLQVPDFGAINKAQRQGPGRGSCLAEWGDLEGGQWGSKPASLLPFVTSRATWGRKRGCVSQSFTLQCTWPHLPFSSFLPPWPFTASYINMEDLVTGISSLPPHVTVCNAHHQPVCPVSITLSPLFHFFRFSLSPPGIPCLCVHLSPTPLPCISLCLSPLALWLGSLCSSVSFSLFLALSLCLPSLPLSDQERGQVCAGGWQIPMLQGLASHAGLTQPPGFWARKCRARQRQLIDLAFRVAQNPRPGFSRKGHLPFSQIVRMAVQESDRLLSPLMLECLRSVHQSRTAKVEAEPRLLGLHRWLLPLT